MASRLSFFLWSSIPDDELLDFGDLKEVAVTERTLRRLPMILFVLLAALDISSEVEAQVAGTISGYIRDESGAVIPGADVRATLIGQQLTRSAVSDETGFFNLLAMPRWYYEITAQLTGVSVQRTT